MRESNVHRRTRVARVGIGGRIGLERGIMSTIDHIEVWLLQIFTMKQAVQRWCGGGGDNGDGGAKLAVAANAV